MQVLQNRTMQALQNAYNPADINYIWKQLNIYLH